MKRILVIVLIGTLTACANFGAGFKPPTNKYYWTLPGIENMNFKGTESIDRREHDMRECGIDPYVWDTASASKALCMEKKGWVYTEGSTCEQELFKDDPLCVQWRSEHGH